MCLGKAVVGKEDKRNHMDSQGHDSSSLVDVNSPWASVCPCLCRPVNCSTKCHFALSDLLLLQFNYQKYIHCVHIYIYICVCVCVLINLRFIRYTKLITLRLIMLANIPAY